ncbi:hypothetical protein [Thiovibrio frasassiensis]|jgi:hypothetical protein|uniref:Uncharacterized protein n=1 Tax=Thiovibrio frasassiensis TaxID=2984131 RepID=A0A9X4MGI8_9BACT|nr:hypothetical protein [Thiovibrio frasassiensis]MDG4475495.1 hypothetical protein [Thiovibrio frasassiensis]
MHTILATTGLILAIVGFFISVAFWFPRLCNRARLREMLGSKYPILYVVYIANGPFLLALGLILLWKFH